MWSILFYEDRQGNSPVLDFIHKLPARDRAKINNVLRLLEEFGTLLGMPHARQIEGRLWELRPGGNRLLNFLFMNNQFVLLHGYRKQSMKAPQKEMQIARGRMEELLEEYK